MFLDVDFSILEFRDGQDHVSATRLATDALHRIMQEDFGLTDLNVVVAWPESRRGAHLFVLDSLWTKVIVTPQTKTRVVHRVQEESGLDPRVVDTDVSSLRILGAGRMARCECVRREPKRPDCEVCQGTGRVNKGDPFSLQFSVDSSGLVTDLSTRPLAEALELTRISWFPDVDPEPL
jgi:hypothetical protein